MCICLQEMLQAGLIVAGYDSREGGQVYAVPLGGTLVKVPFSIGGHSHFFPIHSVAGQLKSDLCMHAAHANPLHTSPGPFGKHICVCFDFS